MKQNINIVLTFEDIQSMISNSERKEREFLIAELQKEINKRTPSVWRSDVVAVEILQKMVKKIRKRGSHV